MLVSANRSADEPWRIERLLRMAAIIARQAHTYQPDASIVALHDHKGELQVTFEERPEIDICGWVSTLWNITENEAAVSFFVGDQPFEPFEIVEADPAFPQRVSGGGDGNH